MQKDETATNAPAVPAHRTVKLAALVLQATGLVVVAVALGMRRLGDFDLPWHLAFGRIVVSTRSLPRIDDLAYTHRPIDYAEFISDVLLFLVVRTAGPLGLQVFGALAGASIGLLLWLTVRRFACAAPIVVAAALAAMSPWLIVRPATLSFVLLALLGLIIDLHRRTKDQPRARRLLLSLIPLQLLWANVHGFAIVGLAIIIAYVAYRAAATLLSRRLPLLFPANDAKDSTFGLAVGLACIGATMVNMAGPAFLTGPIRAANDFSSVTEWASTTPSFLIRTHPATLPLAALLLTALAWGREPSSNRRVPPAFDLFLVAAAAILGASAVRLLPLAAILIIPLVARRLRSLLPATPIANIASSLTITLAGLFVLLHPGTSRGMGFETFHFPEGAVQYIRATAPKGPMWNFEPFGGYLAWRLHPDYRVLVDGRTGWVHNPYVVRQVTRSEYDPQVLHDLVEQFGIQWAVSRAAEGEPFGSALASSQTWQMVYWDDASAVYVLRNGANDALAKDGYRVLRHLTAPEQLLSMAVSDRHRADALAYDGQLAARQAPESPRAAFVEACGALAVRDEPAMRRALERLERLAPGHPAIGVLSATWPQAVQRTPE